MIMGTRENKVEKVLDEQFKKLGGITRKWVSPGVDGVPDRICILPMTVGELIEKLSKLDPNSLTCEVYTVEVKTVDGDLSPAQRREHRRLESHGINVVTVYGAVDVHRFIERDVKGPV